MASCVNSTSSSIVVRSQIEELAERLSKKRMAIPPGYSAVYNGDQNTVYFLRYILRCLGLQMNGTKDQLIERIERYGIKPGDCIRDPAVMSRSITSEGLDLCPTYLLQVYLMQHGLPVEGTKADLISRARTRLGENGRIIPSDSDDKDIIENALHTIVRGKVPDEEGINIMGKHGYFYDSKFNTFIHMRTHEKLLGETGFLEYLWFMTYPFISEDDMVFIDSINR